MTHLSSVKFGDNDSKDEYRRHLAGSDNREPLNCPAVKSYVAGFTTGWLITRSSLLCMYCIIAFYVIPQGIFVLLSKAPILLCSE